MFGALLLNLRRASGLGWRQKPGSSWELVCPPLRRDEGATPAPVPSLSHALTPDPSPLSTLSCPLSTADQTHPTLGWSTGIQAWIHAGRSSPPWTSTLLSEPALEELCWKCRLPF